MRLSRASVLDFILNRGELLFRAKYRKKEYRTESAMPEFPAKARTISRTVQVSSPPVKTSFTSVLVIFL